MGKPDTRSCSSDKFNVDEMEQLITKVRSNFVRQLEDKLDNKFLQLTEKDSEVTNSLKSLNCVVNFNHDIIHDVKLT